MDGVVGLKAGRELDVRIAEMCGWKRTDARFGDGMLQPPDDDGVLRKVPYYSTSIVAAFEIVEEMLGRGWALSLHYEFGKSLQWVADFTERDDEEDLGAYSGEQLGETPALAICRAVLAVLDLATRPTTGAQE